MRRWPDRGSVDEERRAALRAAVQSARAVVNSPALQRAWRNSLSTLQTLGKRFMRLIGWKHVGQSEISVCCNRLIEHGLQRLWGSSNLYLTMRRAYFMMLLHLTIRRSLRQ